VRPSSNQRKVAAFAVAFSCSLFARQIKNSAEDRRHGGGDDDDLSAMPKVVRGCWSTGLGLDLSRFHLKWEKMLPVGGLQGRSALKAEKSKLKLSVYLHKILAK